MATDLKVGILSTIYATWLHNNLAIALVIGMVLAAGLMIWRPKRKLMFVFLGLLLLLIQFEYQKHFGKALEQQTVSSVILQGQHLRAKSVMEDVFQKIIPFFLWLAGWALVFLGASF